LTTPVRVYFQNVHKSDAMSVDRYYLVEF